MNHKLDPLADLANTIRRQRELAAQAKADFEAAKPALVNAIRHHSGQSAKVEKVMWSLWNDEHPVSLCDTLAGLDPDIAVSVLAMIAARAHLGGKADELLRAIIDQSGSQPPAKIG